MFFRLQKKYSMKIITYSHVNFSMFFYMVIDIVAAGEGVGVAVSSFSNLQAFDVEYCAFAQLQRQIRGSNDSNDKTFKMILQEGQTGIAYITN